jgi:hypothetical protein
MVAAFHWCQNGLIVFPFGIRIRFANNVHDELVGSAFRVSVQLNLLQEDASDGSSVAVSAVAPWAVARHIHRSCELVFLSAEDFPQGFLWIELFLSPGERGPRCAEVFIYSFHPRQLVIRQFMIQ